MKGKNKITMNMATMKSAVEFYLNSQLIEPVTVTVLQKSKDTSACSVDENFDVEFEPQANATAAGIKP